jgi:hypothetical protein
LLVVVNRYGNEIAQRNEKLVTNNGINQSARINYFASKVIQNKWRTIDAKTLAFFIQLFLK